MKKNLALLISFGFFAAYFSVKHDSATTWESNSTPTTSAKNLNVKSVDLARKPSSGVQVITSEGKPLTAKTKKVKKQKKVSFTENPALPEGLKIAASTYAVKENDWEASLGKKLKTQGGMVYFKASERPQAAANLAYDPGNDSYYPITPTIKLKGISPELRQRLTNKGLVEHYYNEALKVLFVKSTHEKVLELQAELAESGLETNLEVIRGYHLVR